MPRSLLVCLHAHATTAMIMESMIGNQIAVFSADTICVLAVETDKQTPLQVTFISLNPGALFFSVDILNSSC